MGENRDLKAKIHALKQDLSRFEAVAAENKELKAALAAKEATAEVGATKTPQTEDAIALIPVEVDASLDKAGLDSLLGLPPEQADYASASDREGKAVEKIEINGKAKDVAASEDESRVEKKDKSKAKKRDSSSEDSDDGKKRSRSPKDRKKSTESVREKHSDHEKDEGKSSSRGRKKSKKRSASKDSGDGKEDKRSGSESGSSSSSGSSSRSRSSSG